MTDKAIPMDSEPEWVEELWVQTQKRCDPWIVLEGRHAVEGAMSGWWDIVGILAGDHCKWDPPEWSGLSIHVKPRHVLEETVDYSFHRGIIGLARQPEEVSDIAGLIAELENDALVVVCPRLTDPSNVGAIVRNAAALGADAVVFGDEGVSPFERSSVRASDGALFRIPVRVADGGQVLRSLKAGGFSLIGTCSDGDSADLGKLKLPKGRIALVIGSETDGLGSFWLAACDRLIRIPMESGMDSLNAGAASAICLWEISRLRAEEE